MDIMNIVYPILSIGGLGVAFWCRPWHCRRGLQSR